LNHPKEKLLINPETETVRSEVFGDVFWQSMSLNPGMVPPNARAASTGISRGAKEGYDA
jgi:hypothetical protein